MEYHRDLHVVRVQSIDDEIAIDKDLAKGVEAEPWNLPSHLWARRE